MATTVVLDIYTKPDRLEEMRDFLRERIPEALAFEGSLGVEIVENMDSPGNLVFYEKWESRHNYEQYYAWRESSGVLESFVELLDGDPVIRYFEDYGTDAVPQGSMKVGNS